MRGKGLFQNGLEQHQRITPAYAGKRYRDALSSNDDAGSPPPMRGKAGEAWQENNQSRITPAYAGKSRSSLISVHHKVGSPPPMRGKVVVKDWCDEHGRITPAYAGKSL